MADIKLHTLGCGSAKPTIAHNPSSTVISVNGSLYMFDCGEGAQKMMQRMRLSFSRLNHIFLTHLHGDHVFGLPGLIGTMGMMERSGGITIHTFAEGEKILRELLDFFCRDMPFSIDFNIIRPEEAVIYEDKHLTIRTLPLRHRLPTVGYIMEEKPHERHINRAMTDFHKVPVAMMRRIKAGEPFIKPDGTVIPAEMLTTPPTPSVSYAHISDTAYIPDLASKIGPVDLLFHETTYLDADQANAKKRGHSTAREAATVARDAGAKYLLTGHYSSRYAGKEHLFVEQASEVFPNTILNHEGLVLPIGVNKKLELHTRKNNLSGSLSKHT